MFRREKNYVLATTWCVVAEPEDCTHCTSFQDLPNTFFSVSDTSVPEGTDNLGQMNNLQVVAIVQSWQRLKKTLAMHEELSLSTKWMK